MFKSIMVPIDVDQASSWEQAYPAALAMAKSNGAVLHFVTVIAPVGMSIVGGFFPEDYEEKVNQRVKQSLADIISGLDLEGVEVNLHVIHGTVYEEIVRSAELLDVDLIVMVAHRPELKDYLLGPNAARVVRHARCSVLVIRN